MTQIFFLAGTTSFADPGNWNPVNTVEVVGCGADATRFRTNPPCPSYVAGYGQCGGGYGRGNNRMDPFPVALFIIPHSTAQTGGTAFYSNWADPGGGIAGAGNTTRGGVYAGNAGLSGNAGPAGGPDVGYAGGSFGTYDGTTGYGGGGGGAAGPHGAGAAGSNGGASPTTGGSSDGGTVAGGTGASGNGVSGTQWDASHGTGSGGAGGTGAGLGGRGGQYGGGGAGCGNTNTGTAAGGDALIIVNYTPYIPPTGTNAIYMA